jgi:hypothetical protein
MSLKAKDDKGGYRFWRYPDVSKQFVRFSYKNGPITFILYDDFKGTYAMENGIPKSFKNKGTFGKAKAELWVNGSIVIDHTEKGKVSLNELTNAFIMAESHFSDHPTDNECTYDSFTFHTFDHSPYLIYCLPFGVAYYKELDHE